MYQPLRVNSNIPPRVHRLVQHLNMLLNDVHAMMRLPLQHDGMTAGCNFAAAVFLLEIIGGVSSTMFQSEEPSGRRFKRLVQDYYPWDLEGRDDRAVAAEDLYHLFRNPLAHALGMGGKKGGIGKRGYPEDMLEEFELSASPPPSGTLQSVPAEEMVHLSVDGLYWGVRTMIERLADDVAMMEKADTFLAKHLK